MLQNRRRAAGLAAHLSKTARVACALAAVALLSALLLACVGSRGLTDSVSVSAAQERFEGQWLVEYRTDEGKTSLTLRHRESKRDEDGRRHTGEWNTTRNIDPADMRGLTREQALSSAGTNVRFDIRREAGTFACEGWFRQGSGSGHFTFVPDQGFATELSRRGVGSPDSRQLFSLAMADVGLALLDELSAQGYERPNIEQLVRMGDHGVRVDYLRGMGAAGYRFRTIEALVKSATTASRPSTCASFASTATQTSRPRSFCARATTASRPPSYASYSRRATRPRRSKGSYAFATTA